VKLTPAQVQAFLNRKAEAGLTPRRVQMIHRVLSMALRTAEAWGMVPRNVAAVVTLPRVVRPEITPLTPEQARALLDSSADDRFGPLWRLALATGMREGELLALRWEDVDLDGGWLTVRHTLQRIEGRLTLVEPKTARGRRRLPLPATTVTALRGHRTRQRTERLVAGSRWTDTGFVFTTTIGTPLEAGRVWRAFQAALTKAGLPAFRVHDLRHSSATFLLAQGMTLEDVKQQLGHASITLTSDTYGHVLEGRQRQVAAAMDAVLGG
jgi:integrase